MVPYVTLGNIFGYVALAFICAAALLMFARGPLLKKFRNIALIRHVHVLIAMGAGIFLLLHVASFINFPLSIGVYLGYASFGIIFVVWLTGTAFLERVKDSLLFHGSLSLAAIALALIHSSASTMMPAEIAYVTLACASSVAIANAAFHFYKLKGVR